MAVIYNLQDNFKQIAQGLHRQIVHLDTLMVAELEFTNGPQASPDAPHSHPHEQITYVLEGELFVFIDGEKSHIKKGDVYAIPGNVPHCIQLLSEKVKLLDTFTPLRTEFL